MIEGRELLNEPDVKRHTINAAQVIALKHEDGVRKVLLGKRNTTTYTGQWAFFGGGIEPVDIDLLDTAVREAREELGLELARTQLIPVRPSLSVLSRIVNGRIEDIEISLQPYILELDGTNLNPFNAATTEHSEIRWFGLSEALQMHERVFAENAHVSRFDRNSIPEALAPRAADTIRDIIGGQLVLA